MLARLSSCLGSALAALTLSVLPSAVPAQTLYESDAGSGQIFAFTPTGVKTVFASGFGSGGPAGLAVDSSGSVFVADRTNNSIVKITPEGVQSTFAFTSSFVNGMRFDSNNTLFVTVAGAGKIIKITPDGTQSTFASGLEEPIDVAFDSSGNVFVANGITSRLYKYTPDGIPSLFASGLGRPSGLAIDSSDNIFVSVPAINSIFEYSPNGRQFSFGGLDNPIGLALDPSGNLFVANKGSNSIVKITPGGVQTTSASGLNQPFFLAFAPMPAAVPEPGFVALLVGMGVSGAGFLARRRKNTPEAT